MKNVILGLLAASSFSFAQTPTFTDTVTKVLRVTYGSGGSEYTSVTALGSRGGYSITCSGFTGKSAILYMYTGLSTENLTINLTEYKQLAKMKLNSGDECTALSALLSAVDEQNPIKITVKNGRSFTLSY